MSVESAFTDSELSALAIAAAADYAKEYRSGSRRKAQDWCAERCASDLRHIPWGTYGYSWAIYKEVFDQQVEARLK